MSSFQETVKGFVMSIVGSYEKKEKSGLGGGEPKTPSSSPFKLSSNTSPFSSPSASSSSSSSNTNTNTNSNGNLNSNSNSNSNINSNSNSNSNINSNSLLSSSLLSSPSSPSPSSPSTFYVAPSHPHAHSSPTSSPNVGFLGSPHTSTPDRSDEGFRDDAAHVLDAEMNIPKEAMSRKNRHRRHSSVDRDSGIPFFDKSSSSRSLLEITSRKISHPPEIPPNAPTILQLNANIISIIFKYLPLRDALRCRQVCKLWHRYFSSEMTSHIDLSSINKLVEDKALISLSQICGPRIRHLNLKNCWNSSDIGFTPLAQCSPGLEIVDLNSCWELTDLSLSIMGSNCTSIKCIDFSNCRKVSDHTMKVLIPNNTGIKEIKLSYCKNLTNVTMSLLITHLKNVKVINLQRCTTITDQGFALLRNPDLALNNLFYLNLSDCSFLTDEVILSISKGCPELRILTLTFCCALSPLSITHLANGCKKLTSLDMSFCGSAVYDESMEILSKNMPDLQRISLRSCIMLTKKGLDFLAEGCPKLRIVNVSSCKNITPDVMKQLPSHWTLLSGSTPLQELETLGKFEENYQKQFKE